FMQVVAPCGGQSKQLNRAAGRSATPPSPKWVNGSASLRPVLAHCCAAVAIDGDDGVGGGHFFPFTLALGGFDGAGISLTENPASHSAVSRPAPRRASRRESN